MPEMSLRDEIEAAQANAVTLENLYREYTARYPNQWLAASAGQLYGPTQTSAELRALLEKAGVNLATAQAVYLDPDDRPLIL